MARRIARVAVVFGALVVVANILYGVFDRHPNHGTAVVGGLSIVLGVLLTGLAAAYLALTRGPSHGTLGDVGRVVGFLLMCIFLVMVVWITHSMVEEVVIAQRPKVRW